MARIRTIKPEFPHSETIGDLSRDARLLFIQLWTIVDDEGRARAASRMLASLLYPYDDDAPKLMDGWLAELEQHGCVRLYEHEGSHYLDIPNWLKHQKIDKPSKSRLPSFDDGSRIVANIREASATDLGPRTSTLDQGPVTPSALSVAKATRPRKSYSDEFEKFWTSYPRTPTMSKSEAWKVWQKLTDPDRKSAIAAVPKFAEWARGQRDYTMLHACRFLSQRRFEGFSDANAPEVVEVYAIKLDTPEWKAWFEHTEANGPKFVHSQMKQIENIGSGQMAFRSRWPPGHENQITAPTEIVTPISEHAA